MTCCYRCIVRGRVQGVFFRGATQHQARKLGLTGHAKNLLDGSVEVLVCGEANEVTELCDWLWSGPPAAKVSSVVCEAVNIGAPADFRTD